MNMATSHNTGAVKPVCKGIPGDPKHIRVHSRRFPQFIKEYFHPGAITCSRPVWFDIHGPSTRAAYIHSLLLLNADHSAVYFLVCLVIFFSRVMN
jgi:hypothetical protein